MWITSIARRPKCRTRQAECQLAISGAELRSLMRQHKCTIRELKQRTGITMKRIRECRTAGLKCRHAARDWMQAITGTDPGPQPPQRTRKE